MIHLSLSLFPHAEFDYHYFWKWTQFTDYCYFVVLLSAVGGVVTFFFMGFSIFVELLGFVSLLLEACLGVPQLWRNYSNKSTEGMRLHLPLVLQLYTAALYCSYIYLYIHRVV